MFYKLTFLSVNKLMWKKKMKQTEDSRRGEFIKVKCRSELHYRRMVLRINRYEERSSGFVIDMLHGWSGAKEKVMIIKCASGIYFSLVLCFFFFVFLSIKVMAQTLEPQKR